MTELEQAILATVQQIIGQQQAQALQATVESVLAAVNAALVLLRQIVSDLVDPITGLAAIQAELATFQATQAIDNAAILAAIAATQQSGVAVTLPATTPGGGAWVDDGNVGSLVWGFVIPGPGVAASEMETRIFAFATNVGDRGNIGIPDSPYFVVSGFTDANPYSAGSFVYPGPSVDAILETDTLQSWLIRELPGWHITPGVWGTDQIGMFWPATSSLEFTCTLDDATFEELKRALFPVVSSGSPVWPGLAGVTLGVTVALANGLVVTGPISGVIIEITAVAPPISYYPFGSIRSYVRAGAVVFTTDNGNTEFPQPFGPQSQIVVPSMMGEAASATFRVASGVVGTVTPFTIP